MAFVPFTVLTAEALNEAFEAEATARTSAIGAEAALRSADDDALAGLIAAEESARQAADTALQDNIEGQLAQKAPLASPVFTGAPEAPTAAPGTNNTVIANTAFVQAALAALVDSSPAALDTLNELAAALGNDPNFATTVLTALAGKAAKRPVYVITTNTTAVVDGIYVIAASGLTLTLPASLAAGDMVGVVNGNYTNTVIARNGHNIMSLAENMTVDGAYASFDLLYADVTRGAVIA